MPSFHRTFRLFISSTFSDLRKERDALHEKVFPEIRQFCEDRGYSFQPVDLRWGVSEEAGFDQRTMQICMEEINACKSAPKPNFLVILGDRYGWIPLPYEIEATEFELLQKEIESIYKNEPLKIALLNEWYQKDENNLPPVYVLQPRQGVFEDVGKWELVENQLRQLFLSATEALGWDEEKQEKFITSATEREVFEGIFSEGEKSRSYFISRIFKNLGENDEKDIIEQIAEKDIRDKASFIDLTDGFLIDKGKRNRLLALKEKIKNSLHRENIKEYEIAVDLSKPSLAESIQDEYLDQLCLDVKNLLLKDIQAQIEGFQQVDPLSKELQEQQEFLEEKLKLFIGREEYLEHIFSYLHDPEKDYPLVIYGESGCGKSALMAKAVSMVLEKREEEVIYRFVGTTEHSSNALFVMRSIYQQMDQIFQITGEENRQEEEHLKDFGKFSKLFKEALSTIPKDNKVVIFLDALDQYLIEDELNWLPDKLPENVSIILSTLPEPYGGYLTKLERIVAKEKQDKAFLHLPYLNQIETEALTEDFFHINAHIRRDKEMYLDPCKMVMEGHTKGITGALILPSGDLLSWSGDKTLRIWDVESGRQKAMIEGHPNWIRGVLLLPNGDLLSWSADHTLRIWDTASGHCKTVLKGRIGVINNALLLSNGDLLSWSDIGTPRIWDIESGRCKAVLKGNAGYIGKNPRQFRVDWSYIGALLLPNGDLLSWSDDNRNLRIWDVESGRQKAMLEGHPGWIRSALLFPNGDLFSWSDDGTLIVWDVENGGQKSMLEEHSGFRQRHGGRIYGVLLLPNGDLLSWSEDGILKIWDPISGECKAVLEGHTGGIKGALLFPNGDLLSWSDDGTLRIWDTANGHCKTVLEGHTGGIRGAFLLPNGNLLSWSNDRTLRIWDVESGRRKKSAKGAYRNN